MIIFKLPDLGEGLPDAIIREWYVKPGDTVKADQPLVSMETAKALVDVPSPQKGEIETLFGDTGDTIETGQPLVGFVSADGDIAAASTETARVEATPAVRALAKKLGVDLASIAAQGQRITAAEVEAAAQKQAGTTAGWEVLSPARRAMALSMTASHQHIAPITLCDDADISAWDATQDITIRLVRAIVAACAAAPILNAEFDDAKMACRFHSEVNLGIAIDTEHGLYVPVIKNAAALSDSDLRAKINQFKQQAQEKSIAAADLHGGTIVLSNYGSLAGRYGTPIIVPPMIAIVGVGKARDEVVAVAGKPEIHRIMPLSVSVDHRAATGGDAARFLKVLLTELTRN